MTGHVLHDLRYICKKVVPFTFFNLRLDSTNFTRVQGRNCEKMHWAGEMASKVDTYARLRVENQINTVEDKKFGTYNTHRCLRATRNANMDDLRRRWLEGS